MTATPSAPIPAAWAASAAVSAVLWAPQCTISFPARASRNRSATVFRSSMPSSTPSPVVPSAKMPSTPPSTMNRASGSIAASSTRAPPSRSGVTEADRSMGAICGRSYPEPRR